MQAAVRNAVCSVHAILWLIDAFVLTTCSGDAAFVPMRQVD